MSFCIVLAASQAIYAQNDEADRLFSEAMDGIADGSTSALLEAKEKFERARVLFSEAGREHDVGRALVGLGFVSNSLGDDPSALGYYENALVKFRASGNTYWTARTLNNMGRIYDDAGEPMRALEMLLQVIPLRREANDKNGEAVTLNSIGAIYVKIGDYRRGIEYYDAAYRIRTKDLPSDDRDNRRGIAIILNNLGRVYDELGDSQKSVDFLERALEARRLAGDRNGEAITYNNLGLVLTDRGEFEAALAAFDQCLAILKEQGIKSLAAIARNNISIIYLTQNKPDDAIKVLNEALAYFRETGNRSKQSTALNNVSIALQLKGLDGTEELNSALLLTRQNGEKGNEAVVLANLMKQWSEKGNKPLAAFYGKQAINTYQGIRRSLHTLDEETRRTYLGTVTENYRILADILMELGQFEQANQVLLMLKAEEYYDFIKRDSSDIRDLNGNVSLTEREQALLKRYLEIADKVSALSREFEELEVERRRAARFGIVLSEEKEKRHSDLESLLAEANSAFRLLVEKQLAEEIGKKRTSEIGYDRNLQSKLRRWGNGTVAIYTVVTDNRYRVVLTTPSVQIDGKTDISSSDLNKKVFAFRKALQDVRVDPRPLGKELYDIILKPIEKHLQASGAKTLVWSLDGTLRYLPISALSPDGKTYLVEKYENAVITAQTRDDLDERDIRWTALGLGVSKEANVPNPANPEQLLHFSALPGSVEELRSIVSDERKSGENGLLTGRRLLDDEFTLDNLESALSLETDNGKPMFSVVHLASHFRLGDKWDDSFLLLGNDKYLTLEQITSSPTLDFGNVELVTLSACDTAFSRDANGKEIDSLAGAVQTKSGKAVLATLWSVVDQSTPLLMTEFYKLKKENPNSTKADLMRLVQLKFLSGEIRPSEAYIDRLDAALGAKNGDPDQFIFDRKRPFSHPYFWSPFVLIGNWR
ncbi:MAG: tetratricopeptide repeat protein [Pyrinomonadaceae bacterium]